MNDIRITTVSSGWIVYVESLIYNFGDSYVFNTPKDLSNWLKMYLTKFRSEQNKS